ncbi:hypothetical protein PR048_025239 [Dryococelus australis]|uniref:Exocyst complex component EXOC6/Sec15 N-terminal domain-containing protein n=1 Tax=Dryococelus australis TaxID=614101 RepID=A0ABQ9GQQ9_9NEOP|nr:hypothetical protein PR048_025239 [Dryococelus australis]
MPSPDSKPRLVGVTVQLMAFFCSLSDSWGAELRTLWFYSRAIYDGDEHQKFMERLDARIKSHDKDIERMCNYHYQGFIDSIRELLQVRSQAKKLNCRVERKRRAPASRRHQCMPASHIKCATKKLRFQELYSTSLPQDDRVSSYKLVTSTCSSWITYFLSSLKIFILIFNAGCGFNMTVQLLASCYVKEHLNCRFCEQWIGCGELICMAYYFSRHHPIDYFVWGHMSLVYETPIESEEELLALVLLVAYPFTAHCTQQDVARVCLQSELVHLDEELQESAASVVLKGEELVKARKVESNIAGTIENLSLCLPVLTTYAKLQRQMKEKRLRENIKEASMSDLKDFLENIRKFSPKIGEVAMRHDKENSGLPVVESSGVGVAGGWKEEESEAVWAAWLREGMMDSLWWVDHKNCACLGSGVILSPVARLNTSYAGGSLLSTSLQQPPEATTVDVYQRFLQPLALATRCSIELYHHQHFRDALLQQHLQTSTHLPLLFLLVQQPPLLAGRGNYTHHS